MEKAKVAKKVDVWNPLEIGNAVFIRTITNFYTGRVADVVGAFVVLDDAAWIADTGRFSQAVNGEEPFSDVEPYKVGVAVASA